MMSQSEPETPDSLDDPRTSRWRKQEDKLLGQVAFSIGDFMLRANDNVQKNTQLNHVLLACAVLAPIAAISSTQRELFGPLSPYLPYFSALLTVVLAFGEGMRRLGKHDVQFQALHTFILTLRFAREEFRDLSAAYPVGSPERIAGLHAFRKVYYQVQKDDVAAFADTMRHRSAGGASLPSGP